jgi:glutamate/aspartate transport system substrate-binding protein
VGPAAGRTSSKAPADYAIVGEVLSIEPIAIMLRRGDPEFKKLVDDTVKGLMKSGETQQALRALVHVADPAEDR